MNVELIGHTDMPEGMITRAAIGTRGNEKYLDADEETKLLKKLARMGHWSVFEHATFTFKLDGISRVTQQQLTRHRMASYSVESQRHVKMDVEDVVLPKTIAGNRDAFEAWKVGVQAAFETYYALIATGIPLEDARYILPEATTSTIILTMNARELYHFFSLRMAPGAQWEIRKLANSMYTLLNVTFPAIFNEDILSFAKDRGC